MPERTSSLRHGARRLVALMAASAAVVGASLAVAPAAVAAPATYGTLTIASDEEVTAGDTVTVTVAADTVADLYAYDLALVFDPDLLAFDAGSAVFPTGGFDSVEEAPGALALTHTRLGTSPGLEGPQTLVELTFTSLAAGEAVVGLGLGVLIGTEGEETAIIPDEDLITTTVIAAAPGTEPEPTASPTPTPTPTTTPTPIATGDPAGSGDGDPLAVTGGEAGPWVAVAAFAAALVALGIALLRRRKEAVR